MTEFAEKLLIWFDQHGRKDLPWQQDISPYRVWVSEIMLQQTQVATVIPYYEKFMDRFPSVEALADASEDEVLHQWTGLGYYARARNLHKAAKAICHPERPGGAASRSRTTEGSPGEFPLTVEELITLPGIGKSTAGAIVAICTDQRATILDGNVKRVLSRCFVIEGWPGSTQTAKALWEQAEALTPTSRVADYTQAIMDLGAMVCTRNSPDCENCPMQNDCIALKQRAIDQFPGKKPKKDLPVRSTFMLVIENEAQELLLEKRPNQGLWGGLWSFPQRTEENLQDFLSEQGLSSQNQTSLPRFRHTFTHFHLDITPVKVDVHEKTPFVREQDTLCWFNPNEPQEIGLTRPVSKILEDFEKSPS